VNVRSNVNLKRCRGNPSSYYGEPYSNYGGTCCRLPYNGNASQNDSLGNYMRRMREKCATVERELLRARALASVLECRRLAERRSALYTQVTQIPNLRESTRDSYVPNESRHRLDTPQRALTRLIRQCRFNSRCTEWSEKHEQLEQLSRKLEKPDTFRGSCVRTAREIR